MAREFAKRFYHSKEWQGARDYIMKRDNYLCQICGKPAEEVHHKIHLNPRNISNKEISVGEDNLISLCRDCHFNIHREEISRKTTEMNKKRRKPDTRQGYEFDEDGNVIPITKNVYIVYGSPGSGKTTYVREHMSIGDMVVDLDLIKQALSMQGKTEATDNLLDTSIKVRDLLYQLIERREVDANNIWVVAGLPKRQEREELKERLKAELIFIDTPIHECIRRARADKERQDKQRQVDVITKWWKMYQE